MWFTCCLEVRTWALAGDGGATLVPPPLDSWDIIKIIKVISEETIENVNSIKPMLVVETHSNKPDDWRMVW